MGNRLLKVYFPWESIQKTPSVLNHDSDLSLLIFRCGGGEAKHQRAGGWGTSPEGAGICHTSETSTTGLFPPSTSIFSSMSPDHTSAGNPCNNDQKLLEAMLNFIKRGQSELDKHTLSATFSTMIHQERGIKASHLERVFRAGTTSSQRT